MISNLNCLIICRYNNSAIDVCAQVEGRNEWKTESQWLLKDLICSFSALLIRWVVWLYILPRSNDIGYAPATKVCTAIELSLVSLPLLLMEANQLRSRSHHHVPCPPFTIHIYQVQGVCTLVTQ